MAQIMRKTAGWIAGVLVFALAVCLMAAGTAHAAPSLSKKSITVHYLTSSTVKVQKAGSSKVGASSSNKKVATVSVSKKKVVISAKKPGKTTVKVKVGKKTLKCKVTVPKYKKYKVTKKATCEKEGKAKYYCTHCKKTIKVSLSKTGHVWNKTGKVVTPTCKSRGYTLYTCKVNSRHTKKSNYTATVPHRYENGVCVWCGKDIGTFSATAVADADKITLTFEQFKGIDTGLKVKVLMTTADNAIKQDGKDYLSNKYDSVDKVNGAVVSSFTVGEEESVSFNRYDGDYDCVYNKFYFVSASDNSYLKGPVYVSKVSCETGQQAVDPSSKKGIFTDDIDLASDLSAGNVAFNVNVSSFLYKTGETPDASKAVACKSNGKTFYFNKSQVESLDQRVASFTKKGMSVGLTLLMMKSEDSFSNSMIYGAGNYTGTDIVAVNTSNAEGRDYWIAFIEFITQRYSGAQADSYGTIDALVVGNELDYSSRWNRVVANNDTISLAAYMEEVTRTMRLAYLAASKYRADIPVCMSTTHQWAKSAKDAGVPSLTYNGANFFAPKDMVDYLQKVSAEEGDFNWGLTPHCYGASLNGCNNFETDTWYTGEDPSKTYTGANCGMSGDMNTSTMLTFSNLEILEQYLEQDKMLYNGKLRSVWLNEAGCSSYKNSISEQRKQAAFVAAAYYKCAQLDCIKAFSYYRGQDHIAEVEAEDNRQGLLNVDGTAKIAYDVYKYIDTNLGSTFADKYLSEVTSYKGNVAGKQTKVTYSSWKAAMSIWDTGYDWDALWDESKNVLRTVDNTENYSVSANADSYAPSADVTLAASGPATQNSERVLVCKGDETPAQDESNVICGYYLDDGKTHYSGSTQKISEQTFGKAADANTALDSKNVRHLNPGSYSVYVVDSSYSVKAQDSFKVRESDYVVATDKTEYSSGDGISISAEGMASDDWIGIYKKDETPGTDEGAAYAIYYWYIGKSLSTSVSVFDSNGRYDARDLRSDWNTVKNLPAGEYVVYLAKEGGYEVGASCTFTVNPPVGTALATDKTSYASGEPIRVTATGASAQAQHDWVGILADGDTPGTTQTIYWYYVNDDSHVSGQAYNLQLQELNEERAAMASLPAGKYQIVLYGGDDANTPLITKEITVTGAPEKYVTTDKVVYSAEDAVMVTAEGTDNADWICLFPVQSDVAVADGSAGTPSQYWAYAAKDGQENGTAFKLNDSSHYQSADQSKYDDVLSAGMYRLVLYENDGYDILYETTIVVAGTSSVYDLSASAQDGVITAVSKTATGKDWIGVWKIGSTIPFDGTGKDPSLVFKYPAESDGTVTTDTLEPGDYVVGLYADDGYNMLAAVVVTVS